MTPERWQQIERVFHTAVGRPVSERAGVVAELCAGDDALRAEVESLLAQTNATSFLEVPALAEAARLLVASPTETIPGDETSDSVPAGESYVGPYQMLRRLGSGGMGDVFLAYDSRLRRQVAIKRIRDDVPLNTRARDRLRREAASAATLNHPAVVQIYDILEEPSGDAIVMEYVQGHTLAQMLAGAPFPPARAIGIARQVAEGLAAAHAVGLIHRDLKTQNVMVTSSGQVKILDFGLAKHLIQPPGDDSLTGEGALLGTARSMSPEQAQGRTLDARSDLFSFGVMLYELCTGRPPFHGDSPTETLLQVVVVQPPGVGDLNPEVPPALCDLIRALLEKDPEQRPHSAVDVVAGLAAIERAPALSRMDRLLTIGRRTAVSRLVVPAVLLLAFGVLVAVRFSSRPLGVLVQEPSLTSSGRDELAPFATFTLRQALLRGLTNMDGIETIAPDEVPPTARSVQDAARAMGADEVVGAAITCEGRWCHVSLRRYRGRDGRVLTALPPFDVPGEPENALALTNAVAVHLREIFPGYRSRLAVERLEVKSADYEQYLLLSRRVENGEVLPSPELDTLVRLTQSSPGLIEAYVLAASTARIQKNRERAMRVLAEAQARGIDDPRLVYERCLLAIELESLADAELAIAELKKRIPGDVRVGRARSLLMTRQGNLPDAAEVQRQLVRERPSWKNLWYLAGLETELGDTKQARQHLNQLFQLSPGNTKGQEKLAELEWQTGDPKEAVGIYTKLLKEHVTPQHLANLGWSQLLAGNYTAAGEAYQRVLDIQPDDLLSLLNFGIALEGSGDKSGATTRYRNLRDQMTARKKGALTAADQLLEAQAKARLDDCFGAAQVMTQALAQGDRDSQVIFQVALISALCGKKEEAVTLAKEARGHLSPWWFTVPGFESLRAVPAFRELAGL